MCLFIYSNLPFVVKDSSLGPSSDWDHFLAIDLDDPSVKLVPTGDFLKDSPVVRVLEKCQIGTPSNFFGTTQKLFVSVTKSLYQLSLLLISLSFIKSNILRGLSRFELDVLLFSPSNVYSHSIGCLIVYFTATGHLPISDWTIIISEYKS